MRRFLTCLGLVLVLAVPVRTQEAIKTPPRPALELWDAVYLDGAKAGYRRTTVDEIQRDGQTLYRTTQLMNLTIKRYDSVVTQRMAMTSEETKRGQVVGVSVTHYLDRGKVTQAGRVVDGKLVVTTPSDPDGKTLPWNDRVLGLYGQEVLFHMRKVKPGDRFRFIDYQLALLSAVPVEVEVKDREERDVLEVVEEQSDQSVRVPKNLLRVELKPDKVRVGQMTVPLPRLTVWLNDRLRVVRTQSTIPGMGTLTMYRTTREVAEKEGAAPALMEDLGLKSLIALDRPIPRADQASEVVYHFTAQDDEDPASMFAHDTRQSTEGSEGQAFNLRVRAVREPVQGQKDATPDKSYLESSYFLDSKDEKIQAAAARIVGSETDPWKKAQRIEKWVHDIMKPTTDVGCCPASEVLRSRKGDCRQHAMLMAALCRAAGIPARTDMGLVYALNNDQTPILAFHMWTEVWIKGQWLMLDAMQGTGSVGPTHLKIVDHSWQDIQTLAPLLPALRVIGKVKAQVLSTKPG